MVTNRQAERTIMEITFTLNGLHRRVEITPGETLFHMLRRLDITSVKFGSEDGSAGYGTVLRDGHLCNSVVTLAAQIDGAELLTVEALV